MHDQVTKGRVPYRDGLIRDRDDDMEMGSSASSATESNTASNDEDDDHDFIDHEKCSITAL